MKSHIKTAKMKLPLHESLFIKATAPSNKSEYLEDFTMDICKTSVRYLKYIYEISDKLLR